MNDNDRIDIDMNETLHNIYVSSVIGLPNSHTFPVHNKSSKLNYINMSVDNGDVNGAYFYMNISPGSVINSRDFF